MRSMISVLVLVLVLGSTTSAFARHGCWGRGYGGGFSRGYYGRGPTAMTVSGGYYQQPYGYQSYGSYYREPVQTYVTYGSSSVVQSFGGGRGAGLVPVGYYQPSYIGGGSYVTVR